MAGSYPDVPNHRIAYDQDGTVAFTINIALSQFIGYATQTQLENANSESTSYAPLANGDSSESAMVFMFPVPMDVSHVWLCMVGGYPVGYLRTEYSTDTTNGIDGTWTNLGAVNNTFNFESIRNDIESVALSGVTAIRAVFTRASSGGRVYGMHLYGQPSSTQEKLEIWHPTLDQMLGAADLDWGDDPQGHTETAQFRVKNTSTTETANNIDLTIESYMDNQEFNNAHQLSADDVSYAGTLNIGNLAPGVISSVVYVRKTYTPTQTLGLGWARIDADASGGWS